MASFVIYASTPEASKAMDIVPVGLAGEPAGEEGEMVLEPV